MFDRLIGNERAKETLRRMLRYGRVPGALLFVGEEAIGKKQFAVEVAKALNCRAPRGVEACDECPSCVRLSRFPAATMNNSETGKSIMWSEHRDVGLVRPEKRFIHVEQAREMEREANFRPHEPGAAARVFIIEEADRLNESSGNALLKTLEEMPSTTRFILITSRPAGILTTIRSRCQTIYFAPLAPAEIENFLVKNKHRAGEEARLVARLANGRLGHALTFNIDAYREQREQMLIVLAALLSPQPDRARLLRAAEDLNDPKRKDEYETRLGVLETLIHDTWLLSLDPTTNKFGNIDIRDRLAALSTNLDSRHASRWLGLIEQLRGQLAVNVNRKVATDALFLSMAAET